MERQGLQWDPFAVDLQEATHRDPVLDLQMDFQRLQTQMIDGIDEQGREMSGKSGEYTQKK